MAGRRSDLLPPEIANRSITDELLDLLESDRVGDQLAAIERAPWVLRTLPAAVDRERLTVALERMARDCSSAYVRERLFWEARDLIPATRRRLMAAAVNDEYCYVRSGIESWTRSLAEHDAAARGRAARVRAVLDQVAEAGPEALPGIEAVLRAQLAAVAVEGASIDTLLVAGGVLERVRDVSRRVACGASLAAAVAAGSTDLDVRRLNQLDSEAQDLRLYMDVERRDRDGMDRQWRQATCATRVITAARELVQDQLRCFPQVRLIVPEHAWGDTSPEAQAWSASFNVYPRSLARAVANVMLNACEAIDGEGAVRVDVHMRRARGEEQGQLQITISDDGPGIPPDLSQAVFLPGQSTKVGRFGWGLAVAKRLVERDCGGTVELDPTRTGGTLVRISLTTHHRCAFLELEDAQ